MTKTARDVIAAFEALSPADQLAVAVEIARRVAAVNELPDEAFDILADQIFQAYDSEEASHD